MPALSADASARASTSRAYGPALDDDELFGRQRSSRAELPDPAPMLRSLAHCVIEIFAGARDLEQIARWVTDDVYRNLSKRVVLSARARRAKGLSPQRPVFGVGNVHVCEPIDGVVEAVVLVHQRHRVRAVAIRLEGFDARWRASAIGVL
ncbi:Rv3235 family protein [Agromyces larvae]|uniref:Rv3235 family protein n=1 Tax=Agromyces larvae TaxID=2929802 RepID=A0ABY4BZF2_9MICO|nr:Rv3235 family protein [Agromyces larvae]UOE44538.1 Rv3235 family protein [Agromyces larvae]